MLFKTWLEKGINFQLTTNWYRILRCITRSCVWEDYILSFEATRTSVTTWPAIFVNLLTKFIILCIKTYFPALKHDERKEDTGAAFQSGVLNTNYFRSYTYTFSRRGHREEKKAKRTWKELAGFYLFTQ